MGLPLEDGDCWDLAGVEPLSVLQTPGQAPGHTALIYPEDQALFSRRASHYMDRFGASAPGQIVKREYGLDVDHVTRQALTRVKRQKTD